MLDGLNYFELQKEFLTWGSTHIWTTNTLYQAIILLCVFVFANLSNRILRPHIDNTITTSKIPFRAKKIAKNLQRLITPAITLIALFLITRIISSEAIGLNVSLSDNIMKLLAAWILIRIAVQFVDNKFIRNFFAFSIWSIAALSIFGILDETSTTLDAIGINIGEFRLSALAIIKGILSLFALLYFAIFLATLAERKVTQVTSLTKSSQVLISKIVRITLIVFALLIGLTGAGIDLSLFAVFSGAIGLGIGFGLQKVVSNLFSGFLLLLDKSIKPGDVLEMEGGTFGWVQHMGARYTEVVTRDNKSFLIPNEDFVTQRVVNWSHGNTLIRIEVKFGVDYSHNPHEVKAIAEKAAQAQTLGRICGDPTPVCHFVEFGESSMNFKLRFWIKDAERGVTNMRGAVMLSLWDAFQEHNIKIPYPHREVIITERKST